MLVLSRKESERIRVGDSIVVTVVRLTKDRVRLGIEAPDDVLVLRDELEKEEEPVAVSQVHSRPVMQTTPGRAPLARKMSCYSSSMNGGVALREEIDAETEAISSTRRCPERSYFRYK